MTFADLRDRVQFQENTGTKTAGGSVPEVWSDRGQRWADIKPLSANRQSLAQSAKSTATHTITIWNEAGIRPDWRITEGDRVFEVLAMTVRGDRREWLEFLVSEVQSVSRVPT